MGADLAMLQGQWRVTSLVAAGQAIPLAARIRLDGDLFESTGMGVVYRGRLSLGGDENRRTFTLRFEDGPEAGRKNHALWKLDAVVWTICLDTTGRAAPANFSSTRDDGYAVETLERVPSV
jgi:uncharacterized protein (TIGR03067 family)